MTAAGFYHCSVKGVGRANGRSIVAAAAYRSGERLADERTGETFDYRARGGVLDTFILAPDAAPAWDRAQLWNAAESAEPRANGRLATELELALPHELDPAQRRELVTDFVRGIVERHGVAADVAIHEPGEGRDHRNHHAHVLITHRELDADGFDEIANSRTVTRKRKGELVEEKVAGIAATPADIRAIRQAWEQDVNRAYERAGLDIRTDHRSHEDRGIDAEPSKHLGPSAAAMERRGMDSDRGDANREITARNAGRQQIAALEASAAALTSEIVYFREGRYDELLEAQRAAQREQFDGRYDALRAAEPAPEIERVFRAAAARTTEPVAPSFDRDAANADWADRIDAAGIAAQDARQPPATAPEAETRAGGRDAAAAPEIAASAAIEAEPAQQAKAAPDIAAVESSVTRAAGGLAKAIGDALSGFLNFFAGGPPADTRQQAHDKAQAAGNVETLHAAAYAKSVQATEAARDEQIFRADQEQQLPLAAPEYFRAITRPANPADRQRDGPRESWDRGREIERER